MASAVQTPSQRPQETSPLDLGADVGLSSSLQLVKRVVVGRPLVTGGVEATLLPKRVALPIFASDALSSVAYATEAALAAAARRGGGELLAHHHGDAALLGIVVVS